MVHRHGLKLVGALAIASLIACRKPPPTAAVDAGPPVDHLAKDENVEGTEKAFTLILPKTSYVIYRVDGAVEVEADLTPEQLSNYVRKHVQTTKVTAGASTTTFDDAIVPSDPKMHLRIDVRPAAGNERPSRRDARDGRHTIAARSEDDRRGRLQGRGA